MENETEDKAKEGSLTPSAREAIGDAARANVNAAVEVAKSAVTSFVDRKAAATDLPRLRMMARAAEVR